MLTLKWARERAGVPLSEMGVLLGLKKQSVADLETREVRLMSLYTFTRYLKALDYTVKIEVTAPDGEVFPVAMGEIYADWQAAPGKKALRRKKGIKKPPAKKPKKHITVKGEPVRPVKGLLSGKRQART